MLSLAFKEVSGRCTDFQRNTEICLNFKNGY